MKEIKKVLVWEMWLKQMKTWNENENKNKNKNKNKKFLQWIWQNHFSLYNVWMNYSEIVSIMMSICYDKGKYCEKKTWIPKEIPRRFMDVYH